MNIYGNKIKLINCKGTIFGHAKSLDIVLTYEESGVYQTFDKKYGYPIFLKTNKIGILHETHLDFGKIQDISIIEVINKDDGKIASYQVCSSPKLVDNTIEFPVMEFQILSRR